jgi:histidinol phosphatase-like enzyme
VKIAFLDRDGTIISDYPDHEWRNKTEPEFLQGSMQALKQLMDLGYRLIIVTNQDMINDGIITDGQYHRFHKKMLKGWSCRVSRFWRPFIARIVARKIAIAKNQSRE